MTNWYTHKLSESSQYRRRREKWCWRGIAPSSSNNSSPNSILCLLRIMSKVVSVQQWLQYHEGKDASIVEAKLLEEREFLDAGWNVRFQFATPLLLWKYKDKHRHKQYTPMADYMVLSVDSIVNCVCLCSDRAAVLIISLRTAQSLANTSNTVRNTHSADCAIQWLIKNSMRSAHTFNVNSEHGQSGYDNGASHILLFACDDYRVWDKSNSKDAYIITISIQCFAFIHWGYNVRLHFWTTQRPPTRTAWLFRKETTLIKKGNHKEYSQLSTLGRTAKTKTNEDTGEKRGDDS